MHPVLSSFTSPQQLNGTMLRNIEVWCVVRSSDAFGFVFPHITISGEQKLIGDVDLWWVVVSSDASRFVFPNITTIGELNYSDQCWFVMCCGIIWCIRFCLLSDYYNRWTEAFSEMYVGDVMFDHMMNHVLCSLTSSQQVNRTIVRNVYWWCVVGSSDASRFVFPHITTTGEQNYPKQCWFVMCCLIIWWIRFCVT